MAPKNEKRADPVDPQELIDSQIAQIAALTRRNSELAGFQGQVSSLTSANDALTVQAAELTAERDAAVREAAQANAALKGTQAKSSTNEARIASAQKLAEAVQELTR